MRRWVATALEWLSWELERLAEAVDYDATEAEAFRQYDRGRVPTTEKADRA